MSLNVEAAQVVSATSTVKPLADNVVVCGMGYFSYGEQCVRFKGSAADSISTYPRHTVFDMHRFCGSTGSVASTDYAFNLLALKGVDYEARCLAAQLKEERFNSRM